MSNNILLWSHAHCIYTLSSVVDGNICISRQHWQLFFPLYSFLFVNGRHNPVQWINLTGLYPGNVYMSHYQLLPGSLDIEMWNRAISKWIICDVFQWSWCNSFERLTAISASIGILIIIDLIRESVIPVIRMASC